MPTPPSQQRSNRRRILNLIGLRADLFVVNEKVLMMRARRMMLSRSTLPLFILVLGLTITATMALVQQSGAERERQLLFEQAIERQHQVLSDGLAAQLGELDVAVNFMNAAFPSDVDEFERFFANSDLVGPSVGFDPGIFLVEIIDPAELEALTEREQELGVDDFEVMLLGPPPAESYLVVTRVAHEVSFGPIPILGLEVSMFLADFLDADAPLEAQAIETPDSSDLLTRFISSQPGVNTDVETPYSLIVVSNSIADPDTGETMAWVVRLLEPPKLVTSLDAELDPRLNIEIAMPVLPAPIVIGETDETLVFGETPLWSEVTATTSGLEWTTRFWASSEFGVPTGLADQVTTWTVGLIITATFFLGAVWRAVQSYRLSLANFELEHARTLAATDSLTALLNRQGFIDRVRQLDPAHGGTLYFIDLDGFKRVNDTRGHEAGDGVLRDAAMLLSSQFRPLDVVARFGGDEFAVFTPGLVGVHHAARLSKRVIDSLTALEDQVSCSVGTATKGPGEVIDVLDLVRHADAAMYRAKQQGGGRYESSTPGASDLSVGGRT